MSRIRLLPDILASQVDHSIDWVETSQIERAPTEIPGHFSPTRRPPGQSGHPVPLPREPGEES